MIQPVSPITRMPKSTPISRILSRMSPFKMWLNSCADHTLQLVAREPL